MTRIATRLALGATIGAFALATSVSPALATGKPTTHKTPTSITLKAAKNTVHPNQKDTLTGTLKSNNTPVAGAAVDLKKLGANRTWTLVATKTTDAKGHVTLTVTPGAHKGKKAHYELFYAGDSTHKASHSQEITLTVA